MARATRFALLLLLACLAMACERAHGRVLCGLPWCLVSCLTYSTCAYQIHHSNATAPVLHAYLHASVAGAAAQEQAGARKLLQSIDAVAGSRSGLSKSNGSGPSKPETKIVKTAGDNNWGYGNGNGNSA